MQAKRTKQKLENQTKSSESGKT